MELLAPVASASSASPEARPVDRDVAIGRAYPPLDSAQGLLAQALGVVLAQGHFVHDDLPFQEVLDQQLVLRMPRSRLLAPGTSTFSLRVAVARLVWHLAASSDLGQIAFYEPRVRQFSDDGTSISGSNVGARVFNAAGVDQFAGALERLSADPASRRAAITVWEPVDAVRVSRDIPCTLALVLHIRGGQLVSSALMRSNNALRLLPYNVFELSMLAEIASATLGCELGPYVHFASSLHVFDGERDKAGEVCERALRLQCPRPMPPIPRDPAPLTQCAGLVAFEAEYRRQVLAADQAGIDAALTWATGTLHPYWLALALVLAWDPDRSQHRSQPSPRALAAALDRLPSTHPFRGFLADRAHGR